MPHVFMLLRGLVKGLFGRSIKYTENPVRYIEKLREELLSFINTFQYRYYYFEEVLRTSNFRVYKNAIIIFDSHNAMFLQYF